MMARFLCRVLLGYSYDDICLTDTFLVLAGGPLLRAVGGLQLPGGDFSVLLLVAFLRYLSQLQTTFMVALPRFTRIPRCFSLRGWVCFMQLTHLPAGFALCTHAYLREERLCGFPAN